MVYLRVFLWVACRLKRDSKDPAARGRSIMSLSRSAANLRQLRHARTVEADVSGSHDGDPGFAVTERSKPRKVRHSATSEDVTHSLLPLQPLVAWEETATERETPPIRSKQPPRPSLSEPAWPPPDFSRTELPKLGATQIMAVRIDKSGAPLGAPQGRGKSTDAASGLIPAKKVKTRGVTLGGWRNGVTAVKFSSTFRGFCSCGPVGSHAICCLLLYTQQASFCIQESAWGSQGRCFGQTPQKRCRYDPCVFLTGTFRLLNLLNSQKRTRPL
jgi:hypothetical protein